jgi:hypothetical protein
MFRFEKLTVWQKAIDLADAICKLTRTFTENAFDDLYSKSEEVARMLTAYYADLWPRCTRFERRKPAPASEYRSQQ